MSQYRDWHEKTDWVMADDALTERTAYLLSPDSRSRWLRWNCMPSTDRQNQVEALRIRTSNPDITAMPSPLKALRNLKYVSMPLDYAATLREDWLPPSVETLSFEENGTGRASISREIVLPSVRRLLCVSGTLMFAHSSFPNLRSVSMRLDAKRRVVDELLKFSRLPYVHVGPVHTSEDLQALSALAPEYLGILGGRLENLEALPYFPELERLWLHSLSKLTDISAVAEMPSLKSIELLYCTRVADLRPLLRTPGMRELSIVQCKSIELAPVVDEFIEAGLERLSITGDKYLYRDGDKWVTNVN